VLGEARAHARVSAGKRFTYHCSELMALYGTFLADLPKGKNKGTMRKKLKSTRTCGVIQKHDPGLRRTKEVFFKGVRG
jgi:hypothetical protein